MDRQTTFTDFEYENRKRTTKRESFLEAMDAIIPWAAWCALIAQFYYDGKRGRKPKQIETMLRMYLLQIWFSLSDEGVEEAIYDSYAMRRFMGIDFSVEQVPDATTLLKFRHILEKHNIAKKLFMDVSERLDRAGLTMRGGSIVDATIIKAPSSTKNEKRERDPEMHSTKKGNQWYFGMKIHAAVDSGSGYVHTITATAANAHDVTEAHNLIREDDRVVYGDSGYLGVEKRDEIKGDPHLSEINYVINRRPSQNRITPKYQGFDWDRHIERMKAAVRGRVEHPFNIVKNYFHTAKTRYVGLGKNLHMFHALFASANLLMCIRAGRQRDFCTVMG